LVRELKSSKLASSKIQRPGKDLTQRAQRTEHREHRELEKKRKRRGIVALERKNPPFAKSAKGGAPSSFGGGRLRERRPASPMRGQAEGGPYNGKTLEVAPGGEAVVDAFGGEAEGGYGVLLGEPGLELFADLGLQFDEARHVVGLLPFIEFGGEMDGGGAVGGIGSEIADGGDDATGVELPFDEKAVGGKSAMERAGSDTVKIGNDLAADATETIEIEMGVAGFERIESPFDETHVAGEGFFALEKFEETADAAIAVGGDDGGHVRVEIGSEAVKADERHGEADHGVAVESAEDLTAGLVGDDEGDVGLGLEIGFAPDFALDFDAAVKVREGGAFADLDVGSHGRRAEKRVDSLQPTANSFGGRERFDAEGADLRAQRTRRHCGATALAG